MAGETTERMMKIEEIYNSSIAEEMMIMPFSRDTVYLKPMRTKEQKPLLKALSGDNDKLIQEIFDEIILKCVVKIIDKNDKEIPVSTEWVDSLYTSDRLDLLLYIRGISIDTKYDMKYICQNTIEEDGQSKTCGNTVSQSFNLEDFFSINDNVDKNLIKQTVKEFANGKIKIFMSMGTRKKMKKYYDYKEKRIDVKGEKMKELVIDVAISIPLLCIDKIIYIDIREDGKEEEKSLVEIDDIATFIDIMRPKDQEQLLEYLKQVGKLEKINRKEIKVKCDKCKHERELDVSAYELFMTL